jgi:ABC-type amino acid transport substrate-binding protein
VPVTWASLAADFDAKCDVAVGGISDNPDRRRFADFSISYGRDGKTPITRRSDADAYSTIGLARDKLHAGYSVTEAAMAAGYGSSEAMRRAFVARIGISPRKYQQRFQSTGSAAPFDDTPEAAVS